jgi:anti-anti-sigma factor
MPHAMSDTMLETTLQTTVQRLGDVAVVHLAGRLVRGEGCSNLRDVVFGQTDAGMIVLNLAQVDRIDAWGLGALLRLREWARSQQITFKLMNTVEQVERLLHLTRLDRVFEFCSVRDQFCLMQGADRPTQAAVA